MQNILFYKYVTLSELPSLKEQLLGFCKQHNLKGKILLAVEGINGCLSGKPSDCAAFETFLAQQHSLDNIQFKRTKAAQHTFKRMLVKIRPEIITLNAQVDVGNAGRYVEPEELRSMLDAGEDVVLLDARNNYESDVGRFAGAVTPALDTFSAWPQAVQKLTHLKKKKIVTYCTGGIRCEKASAYLRKQGFEQVYQLHGGILSYGNTIGDKHWEGLCVVFDKRGAVEIDPAKHRDISLCVRCMTPEDAVVACAVCNESFVSCADCTTTRKSCCSKKCFQTLKT